MKKQTSKSAEIQLLDLLKKVLPKATHDPELAGKIYEAIEAELHKKVRVQSFDKFCDRLHLPDLEDKSIADVQRQLTDAFQAKDITLQPNKKEKALAVEINLDDGTQLTGAIKVNNNPDPGDGEQDVQLKFVPFPVCLPTDKELIWMLAKKENLSPEEGGMALAKVQDEFWGSKAGQKALRDRVDKTFAEFISRVPSGMLSEVGLKRHYKTPEPLKELRASKN
jgi:hypothetical protein